MLVLLVSLSMLGWAGAQQVGGWHKIDADGLFSFSLPQGFRKTDMTGVEHYLGEYYQGRKRFLFIWGDTASNAYDVRREPDMKDYQEHETTMDGRPAIVRSYYKASNAGQIYHNELNVGDWKNGEIILYMELESDDRHDIEVAREIFKSVTFTHQKKKSENQGKPILRSQTAEPHVSHP